MQENTPSPRPRILLGFAFCAFLIIIAYFTGWYGNFFISRLAYEVNEDHRVAMGFHQAIHQLDAMQLVASNFQTTNDPNCEQQIVQHVRECEKTLDEFRMSLDSPENQRLAEELRFEAERFFKTSMNQFRFGEEFQKVRKMSVDAKAKTLISMHEFEKITLDSTNEKVELISMIRRIEQAIFQCDRLLYTAAIFPQSREKNRDEFQKNAIEMQESLEKLKTFLFSEESKKLLAGIEDQLKQYHDLSSKVFSVHNAREQLQSELDESGARIKNISDNISDNLAYRQQAMEMMLHATQNRTSVMLTLVVFVSLFLCGITALFVLAGVKRGSSKPHDPYPAAAVSAAPDTMRLVADKLQEAVDLLRRN